MSGFWDIVFVNPILNILIVFYGWTSSLGVSIILLTLIVRAVLIPVMVPSIKAARKQRELKPEIDKLKEKYKDRQILAQKQMELLKKHGMNPTSGCLSQIVFLVFLFALFAVIRIMTTPNELLSLNDRIYSLNFQITEANPINTNFWYMDLAKPDPYYVLAIVAGLVQAVLTVMNLPYSKVGEKLAKKTPGKGDDMAAEVQKQMMYMLPVMNVIFGLTLPSGLMLYIVISSVFSIAQTYYLNGLGGLEPWLNKLKFGKR